MGGTLKLKIMAGTLIVAIASIALAIQPTAPQKHQKPPTIPTVPIDPKNPKLPPIDPSKPDWPNIPLPGDPTNPKGEPGVPFPLSTTLPFPWGYIEGIWRVEVDGANLFFSFKIETDVNNRQLLRAIQVDHTTGDVLAEGVGLRIEGDKIVRVAMISKIQDRGSYMLFIGSYKNDGKFVARTGHDGAPSAPAAASKSVTVLTVRSFADLMGDKDVQVVITKVSNTPYPATQKYLPKAVRAY